MQPPHSICILRLSAIGDVCHAVASVQAIQRNFPSAEITWIIGKVEATLVRDLPGIRFVIFDKSQGWRAYLDLRRNLTASFDVLLHMQLSLRANLAALMVRAKRKVGFPTFFSKELHRLVVNEHIELAERPHVVEAFQAFAYALGVPDFKPTWNIPVSDEDRSWAMEKLKIDTRKKSKTPILVISAAASKPERSWLPASYAAVADFAVQKGFTVVLTGGPSPWEKSLAKQIKSCCKSKPLNLVGKTNLKQLLAIISIADIMLTPDSGPAHMAVTQATPVIGLYAHSNPDRTGPYLYRHYVVDLYHHFAKQEHGLEPNKLKWGTRVKGENLMAEISVEQVCAMFDQVIRDMKKSHG